MTHWLVLLVIVAAASCGGWWWWKSHPYGKCRWCGGSGRNPLSTQWRSGDCRHCGGKGRTKKEDKK